MFVLEVLLSVPVANGMNVTLAYPSNVETDDTGSACTNAAPSNTLTSYDSGGEVYVSPLVMHLIRSDFLVERGLPNSDNDGGYNWFSCMKNSSRSLFRIWRLIYGRLNKKRSLVTAVSFCDALDICFGCCRLNSGKTFLDIVS